MVLNFIILQKVYNFIRGIITRVGFYYVCFKTNYQYKAVIASILP